MKRSRLVLGLAAALLFSFGGALAASPDYAEGQKLFAQKNYRAAAAKFESAMKATPRDANTIYYCALASQMSSNRARARQLYEYLTSGFPGTQIATMASTALGQLGGAAPASGSTGGSASSGSSSAPSQPVAGAGRTQSYTIQCTDEFKVPFQKGRNGSGVYVDGTVNNQSMRFHLDTGAFSTAIGQNQMEALGLGRGAAGKKFELSGIGDRSKVEGWGQTVTLRIGQAYIRDFPITVQDHMEGDPLLGQDFLRHFDTEIDPEKMEVTFRTKGSGRKTAVQPRGTIDVPFKNGPGGHIIVTAEVNGRPYEMFFDTGADSVCFGMADMKKLGLEVPSGAREGLSKGIAGDTRTWSFPVQKFKVGTIVKEDFEISVAESAKMGHPLLGQSFFGEYRHKVDAEAHVIHLYPPQ